MLFPPGSRAVCRILCYARESAPTAVISACAVEMSEAALAHGRRSSSWPQGQDYSCATRFCFWHICALMAPTAPPGKDFAARIAASHPAAREVAPIGLCDLVAVGVAAQLVAERQVDVQA